MAALELMTPGRKAKPARTAPPRSAAGLPARHRRAVEAVCAEIEARAGEPVTLAELAETAGMSPWYLQRLFKKALGISPRDYADALRGERFRDKLRQGDSIAGATYEAGYGSSSRVYERANKLLGMTPASYAKGGRGAAIAYSLVDSPLGRLLVAATAKGVCFVSLGRDDTALTEALRSEFPEAEPIERDDQATAAAVTALIDHLDGTTPHADLPLDVRATAFQRRVWQELRAIPAGETRSYAEIAAAMGLPNAQRAVGNACASNPVAIIVPCHRGVRADGSLGGYRWGPERKEHLLNTEAERG